MCLYGLQVELNAHMFVTDILFIVDESGSIPASSWTTAKTGIANYIETTENFGFEGTRFGWIQFDTTVTESETIDYDDFDDPQDKQALKAEILGKVQGQLATNQAKALERALDYYKEDQNELRPGSQSVMIFLTDGR